MKWVSKTFFASLLLLTILSVSATFYEVVVLQDFDIILDEETGESDAVAEDTEESDPEIIEEKFEETPVENTGEIPVLETSDEAEDTGEATLLNDSAI